MDPSEARVLVLDFETLYGDDYTLSKMTTEEYVRDPRFHAYGLSYKWFGETDSVWVRHDDVPAFLNSINWEHTSVLAHNAAFDVAILHWKYGKLPKFIYDTLSMSRAVHGVEAGHSLGKLAERYGLPPKGTAVNLTKNAGKVLHPAIEQQLAEYCCHDVDLCEQVFTRLYLNGYYPGAVFPRKELKLIDMTLRMYVDPVLQLNRPLLEEAKREDDQRLADILARVGASEGELASTLKFAEVLQRKGVYIPTKVSRTSGEPIHAFAKSDAGFQALLNGDDEDVALLCEARLRVKSTIERTRAQRFIDIVRRGTLPVPLKYYGARTGRWSAAKEGINLQNMKRKSFLRDSIVAPPGMAIVVGDLSQIEPRVLAWYAGHKELLETFRSGRDAYAEFGTSMFGQKVTKDGTPALRQSAKSALLGCGYGLSWPNMAGQLLTGFLGAPPIRYDRAFLEQLGDYAQELEAFVEGVWREKPNTEVALETPHSCSNAEMFVHCAATRILVAKYRSAAKPVTRLWNMCDELLGKVLSVPGKEMEFKGLRFEGTDAGGRIFLPNGLAMIYDGLHHTGKEYIYGNNYKLYGSKIVENIVQGVARVVMSDGMLRVARRYRIVATAHDEIVCLAPEHEAEEAKTWVLGQMCAPVKYLEGIPLAAEGGYAKSYGEAKQ